MKKKAVYIMTFLIMGAIWFDLLNVEAQVVAKQVMDVGVNQEKAVISALFAAVAGIFIFAFRHKKRVK